MQVIKKIDPNNSVNGPNSRGNNENYTIFTKIPSYDKPPGDIIGINDFQQLAVVRLQILKKIQFLYDSSKDADNSTFQSEINKFTMQHNMNVEGHYNIQRQAFDKLATSLHNKGSYSCEQERNDAISHFICRLAYCRTDELMRWFTLQEGRFFSYRLQAYKPQQILEFLKSSCDLKFEELSDNHPDWKAKQQYIAFNIEKQRKYLTKDGTAVGKDSSQFIKIPFKEALSLIDQKKAFLWKGFAYVHISDLAIIARNQFRVKLQNELQKAHKHWALLVRDPRLGNILMQISNHNQIDFNLADNKPTDLSLGEKIRLGDLDYHQRKSFPPCMKALYTRLKNQSHLKHFGRLQLGRFLKDIGLTMDESMQLWKSEFSKKMDVDKFEKNYAYNIRHMYGQEGKRVDYKSWTCFKIIQMPMPATGEFHGCPFKSFNENNLRGLLLSYQLTQSDINVIIDKQREGMHQVACLRLFEFSHPSAISEGVGNHPNAFFNSSLQYEKEVKKKDAKNPAK